MSDEFLSLEMFNNMLLKENQIAATDMVYEYKRRYVTDNYFINATFASGKKKKYFLKIYHTDRADVIKETKEIDFYKDIATQMPGFPFVPVYGIGYFESGAAYILLADMTETHISLLNCHSCSAQRIIQYMEYMAKFHAFWWDNEKLGKDIGDKLSKNDFSKYIERLSKKFEEFIRHMGNEITIKYMRNVDMILNHWELFFDRINSNINLTLIHGDANPIGNVLFPRSESNSVLPIDWQGWNINMGMKDFAHAIGLNFYPHERRNFENELLRRYYNLLIEHEVKNYSFHDCMEDYKMCLCTNLFSPIILLSWGIEEGVWWPYYVKSQANVEDMDCLSLL